MNTRQMLRRGQRGVALLTALLIIALAAIIGTAMLSEMNIALHRSGNIWNSQQAWWYGIGIENWLGAELRLDAKYSKIDTLKEEWAQPVDYLPIDGGNISGQIIDLQGRFNLNNLGLGNPDEAEQQFERLIELVTGTDVVTAQTIAQSTRDWIDGDINPTTPYGAEDDYYLGLSPAYRTSNTLMVSPSELRLVKGVTPQIYSALLPYIATLPTATPINVDTASAAILQTLAADLPNGTGTDLAKIRDANPWTDEKEFRNSGPLAGHDIATPIALTTNYFLVVGTITVGDSQTQFYSVLARANDGIVKVLRHSIDTY